MQSNLIYANEVHSECCLVSISSIENLFSVDFAQRCLSLSHSRSSTHRKKPNRTMGYYNGKEGHYGQILVNHRHQPSMLAPSVKKKTRGREYEALPKFSYRLQVKGDRRGKMVQPSGKMISYTTANYQLKRKYEMGHRFSYCKGQQHTLSNLESAQQEYVTMYRAFNEVKDEVHCFNDKITQYLNGAKGYSKVPELKNLIIAMLFTTEKKFDDMISAYISRHGCVCVSQCNHQEKFRKRLCEIYRLILICHAHGFIGLSSTSRSVIGNAINGRKEVAISGTCGERSDKRLAATKLSEDLEKSSHVLVEINERICSGIKYIHSQCPTAIKSKESNLMCIQLGINVAERLLAASSKREMMRAFVAWRLDSQLRYNKVKVTKFKCMLSQRLLIQLLSVKRAQTLQRHFKNWWTFTRKKRKEERVLSSLKIQLAWSKFVHRQYLRMLQLLKLDAAISFQRVTRGYLALRRSDRRKRDIKAAVVLQVIVRISLAKNTLFAKRQERILFNRLTAALTVQKALRRYSAVCKRYLLRSIRKAIRIQSQWRCHDNRSRFLAVKGAMTIQRWVRRLLSINERERRTRIVVICIQCAVRVYAAHCERNIRRRTRAASKLQDFMALVLATRKWQRDAEYRAARVVQGCTRRYLSMVLRIQIKSSIKTIQNMVRRNKARIIVKKLRDEKIQTEFLLKEKRKKILQMMLIVQFNPSYL